MIISIQPHPTDEDQVLIAVPAPVAQVLTDAVNEAGDLPAPVRPGPFALTHVADTDPLSTLEVDQLNETIAANVEVAYATQVAHGYAFSQALAHLTGTQVGLLALHRDRAVLIAAFYARVSAALAGPIGDDQVGAAQDALTDADLAALTGQEPAAPELTDADLRRYVTLAVSDELAAC